VAPEPAFRVQRAGAQDLEDFLRLRIALFRDAGQARPSFDWSELEPRTRAIYLSGIESGTLLVWMARSDAGAPIGSIAMYLLARLPTPTCPSGEEGYVVNVYTVPEWRRRGVGTELMQAVLAESRARKLDRLRLHSTAEGRKLYENCGFRVHPDHMQILL
jgi:ribosomal protein S18 acetylase RimI-like enzyme